MHNAWLERNSCANGGELDVPFEELSVDEQNKDLAQIETALEMFHDN